MARKKDHKGVRFEIWPMASELNFIGKHLVRKDQSAKNWIELLISSTVYKGRKRVKEIPFKTKKKKAATKRNGNTEPKQSALELS